MNNLPSGAIPLEALFYITPDSKIWQYINPTEGYRDLSGAATGKVNLSGYTESDINSTTGYLTIKSEDLPLVADKEILTVKVNGSKITGCVFDNSMISGFGGFGSGLNITLTFI